MVRAGLGLNWSCLFANDFDHKKGISYRKNWGVGEDDKLKVSDIRDVTFADLPGQPDLVWGSFPCQDLSLAGGGAGLKGDRSGTFWPFWDKIKGLKKEGRAPKIIVLENVCGTLTSHQGKDFNAICDAFAKLEYQFGAVVIDAAHFVPQSRPRLFIIGVRRDIEVPSEHQTTEPHLLWHNQGVRVAYSRLSSRTRNNWIWWNFPAPAKRRKKFADLIEDNPASVDWHTPEETRRLLSMMSDVNLNKVRKAKSARRQIVGAIYKRTRLDENDEKVQRAEIRFDDIAGCLRTPAGGSSRQLIMVINGKSVRSRLISTTETARLMGLPDSYILPDNYNEAYHLTGDGVVVPVVRYLAEQVFEPVLNGADNSILAAA